MLKNKIKKSHIIRIGAIAMITLFVFVGYLIHKHNVAKKEALLSQIAPMNKHTPRMIAEGMRFEGARIESEQIYYDITLINALRSDIEVDSFSAKLKQAIKKSVCDNDSIQELLSKTNFFYVYKDKNQEPVVTLEFTQDDCKK